MEIYEPRAIASKVYQNLNDLKAGTSALAAQKEQKSQAVELYSYLAEWGLLRLKAEELALQNKPKKKEVVECFFNTLGEILDSENPDRFQKEKGLNELGDVNQMGASEYLGLMGLAMQVAREFAFWAEAIYPKDAPPSSSTSEQS